MMTSKGFANPNFAVASAAPTRAADAVVARLEAGILPGELPDGVPLPAERELMKRFGTSRTVIREAIAALPSQ